MNLRPFRARGGNGDGLDVPGFGRDAEMGDVPSVPCFVEIESQWTARRRERTGVVLLAKAHPPANNAGRVGQPHFEKR